MDGRGNELVYGDVLPYPAEFALEADSSWVVGARSRRVKWGAALRVGIMVIILH